MSKTKFFILGVSENGEKQSFDAKKATTCINQH